MVTPAAHDARLAGARQVARTDCQALGSGKLNSVRMASARLDAGLARGRLARHRRQAAPAKFLNPLGAARRPPPATPAVNARARGPGVKRATGERRRNISALNGMVSSV